jgi:hypothetical protein
LNGVIPDPGDKPDPGGKAAPEGKGEGVADLAPSGKPAPTIICDGVDVEGDELFGEGPSTTGPNILMQRESPPDPHCNRTLVRQPQTFQTKTLDAALAQFIATP